MTPNLNQTFNGVDAERELAAALGRQFAAAASKISIEVAPASTPEAGM